MAERLIQIVELIQAMRDAGFDDAADALQNGPHQEPVTAATFRGRLAQNDTYLSQQEMAGLVAIVARLADDHGPIFFDPPDIPTP